MKLDTIAYENVGGKIEKTVTSKIEVSDVAEEIRVLEAQKADMEAGINDSIEEAQVIQAAVDNYQQQIDVLNNLK